MLFKIARSRVGRQFIVWVFKHMSFAIPIHRLSETKTLLAFYHPQPSYPIHILLVSKQPYATLLDLSPGDADFLRDLIETVQNLVQELNLERSGYRLIANGGPFQDIPHLHFHLIAGTFTGNT